MDREVTRRLISGFIRVLKCHRISSFLTKGLDDPLGLCVSAGHKRPSAKVAFKSVPIILGRPVAIGFPKRFSALSMLETASNRADLTAPDDLIRFLMAIHAELVEEFLVGLHPANIREPGTQQHDDHTLVL